MMSNRFRQLTKRFVDQNFPALPSLHPLAVGDVLLMRSPRELIAVDIQTGKRIWLYPWDTDLAGWTVDGPFRPGTLTIPPRWSSPSPIAGSWSYTSGSGRIPRTAN